MNSANSTGIGSLLRLGVERGSRWRVLALFTGLALMPSALAVAPAWAYLSTRLDHAVGYESYRQHLTPSGAMELLRGLGEDGSGSKIGLGLVGGLLVALLVAPWSAGAAMAESRSTAPTRMRPLLGMAGELYGRLVRMTLVALVPLGIAGGVAAGLMKGADALGKKALTEAAAYGWIHGAEVAAAVAIFLAHLTLDAGRAHLAVRPERRSALLAWAAGAWMVIRRPVRSIALGAAGAALALVPAMVAMSLRERLPPGPGWSIVLGFLLATAATTALAWGRSVRLAALAELAAQDGLERARNRALRAARKATRVAKTEPLLPAMEDPGPTPAPPLGAPAAAAGSEPAGPITPPVPPPGGGGEPG